MVKLSSFFLPRHNGEFALYNSDIECSKTVLQNSNYAMIGQAILDVLEMADKSYPEKHILSDLEEANISLPTDSVTLLFKKANENFYDEIKLLVKEISVEE